MVHRMIQSQFILQDLGASVCPQVVKAKAAPKEKVTPEKSKPKTKKEKAEAAKKKSWAVFLSLLAFLVRRVLTGRLT